MSRLVKLVSTRVGIVVSVVVALAVVGAVIAVAGGGKHRRTQSARTQAATSQGPTGPSTTAQVSVQKAHKKRGTSKSHASSSGASSSSASSGGGSSGGGSSGGGSSANTASGCSGSGSASAAKGQVVMYGNSPVPQFQPVLDAFAKAYPGIHVTYSDVDDNVAFSKYRAEHAQGARTADIIMASSPQDWDNNQDVALCWTPSGLSAYPSFVKQFPGIFVVSPDPAVSLYNKVRIPPNQVPTSFAQLESELKRYPSLFRHKIVTYSVNNQFGYSAFWGLVQKRGWSDLNILGPASSPQSDGTAIATHILSGAANYAFFEAGLVRGALVGAPTKIVGWTYMHDFTPLIPRGIAIMKGAGNPAAAKVFINWLYGAAGQQVMCAAGFTAFRSGISCANSMASVQQAVGASNVYLVPFHSSIAQDSSAFATRWHRSFG